MEKVNITGTSTDEQRSGDLFAESDAMVLVPLNRESAVSVLSSLCVSDVPVTGVSIPVQDRHLSLLTDGLRSSEAEIVSAGDRRRFPVLLEFPFASRQGASSGVSAFGLSELRRIIFRSSTEADEFRLRPFDEFDTEALPHAVEPSKFGLAGEPRFSMQVPDDRKALADLADRFAAGVHDVLLLAETQVSARAVAADFLKVPDGVGPPGLRSCWTAATGDAPNGITATVVQAFALMDSRSEIIDQICRDVGATDAKVARAWGEVARGVLQNRIQLTGEHLSDDGSVLLRSALLALSADSPAALLAFLGSEHPPGHRVTVTASFLVGLKTGVSNLSWGQKKDHLARLSSMACMLLVKAFSDGKKALDAITVDTADGVVTVKYSDVTVSQWAAPANDPAVRDVQPASYGTVANQLSSEGYAVCGEGAEPNSYQLVLGERTITMVMSLNEQDPSCVLMFVLPIDAKFRKKSEILSAFSRPGMLWRLGSLDGGAKFLFCDLPRSPQRLDALVLAAKLEDALKAVLVPLKVKKSALPRTRKPKTVDAESATKDFLDSPVVNPDRAVS